MKNKTQAIRNILIYAGNKIIVNSHVFSDFHKLFLATIKLYTDIHDMYLYYQKLILLSEADVIINMG